MQLRVTTFGLVGFTILAFPALTYGDNQNKADATVRVALQNPTVAELPILLKLVKDETHCFPKKSKAVEAIVKLGERAVPAIVAEIKSGDSRTWKAPVRHAYLLAMIGPAAKAALPELEQLAAGPKPSRYTMHFVATAKAAISEDLDQLAQLAGGADIGLAALGVLEHLGPQARSVAPKIATFAREKPGRRRHYLRALESIEPQLAKQLKAEFAAAKTEADK